MTLRFLVLILTSAFSLVLMADSPRKPMNVVLILADDLGWKDLKCYGSDLYETPHIDQLANEGARFTQHYSACTVCSPTRAALLTGKYPARLHLTDWIPGAMPDNPKLLVPDWTKFLSVEETTLAELFRDAGYRTASIGKWHLGDAEHYPEKHGFEINIGGTDKPQPPTYFAPWQIPTLGEGKPGDFLTDRLAEEAVKFIESSQDKPFFLYLPHFAVHTPIQAPAPLVEKYRAIPRQSLQHKNAVYAAMIERLDHAVGEVLKSLDAMKLREQTIVIFTSDNGGRITKQTTDNSPLRYGKASAYEGGVRVPLIIRWPGITSQGKAIDTPCITMDLFATLREGCQLIGKESLANDPSKLAVDGISLLPALKGQTASTDRDLFWHYPHHQHYQLGGTMPYGAIRSRNYKLIEFYDDGHTELYDLEKDLGETHDLAESLPDVAVQLKARLHAWREAVDAQMPLPNPRYDASRPQYNPAN